jgi:NADH dehydrogenase
MPTQTDHTPPHVVIVGAGFGGLWAARALANEAVTVRLLDRNNYHTFLPLLYQVAASELEPGLIARSARSLVHQQANTRFVMAEVERIDLDAQVVHTAGQAHPYDYLILALGSVNHFFDTPGAEAHCFTLKSLEEGVALRNHILRCVERAAQLGPEEDAERSRLLTFVVVGGGPTGVEYAGALVELLYHPLASDYPELDLPRQARVVLLEAADGLLRGVGGGDYARRRLEAMGVEVRLASAVAAVTPEAVVLAGGESIATASPVWTAGVRGATLAGDLPWPRARGGRLPVRPSLQAPDYDNVFVIGDLAYLEQDGQALPGVAQVAMQQGEHAAAAIARLAQRDQAPPPPFRYRDKGAMATVGRNAAVAMIGGRLYTGFPAWLIWLAVHIVFLIGFRNRLGVLINWAWNYIFYERAVRLILPRAGTRLRL